MAEQTQLEEMVESAAAGEDRAWTDLWSAVHPRLLRLASSPRVSGRMSQNEDDCRNIVVEVMARLRDSQFRRLKLYLDAKRENPDLAFEPWLVVVARRVAVDYLRGHGEYIDRRRNRNPESAPGRWVHVEKLTTDSRLEGDRPPVTNQGAALTMMRYAYKELPKEQLTALERWLLGASFEDIASELDIGGAKDAEKLVRAALQRLRRTFRDKKKK